MRTYEKSNTTKYNTMKKIRLTENELKRMIVNVMEQVADNNPNEGGPNYSIDDYYQMFESKIQNVHDSISDVINLYHELSGDTSIDPEEKDGFLFIIKTALTNLSVDSEDVTGDMDDENQ